MPKCTIANIGIGALIVAVIAAEKVGLQAFSTSSYGCRFVGAELLFTCHAFAWGSAAVVRAIVLHHGRRNPSSIDDLADFMPLRPLPKGSVLCCALFEMLKTILAVLYAGELPAALSVAILSCTAPLQLLAQSCCQYLQPHAWQVFGAVLAFLGTFVCAFTLCGVTGLPGFQCPQLQAETVFASCMLLLAPVCEVLGRFSQVRIRRVSNKPAAAAAAAAATGIVVVAAVVVMIAICGFAFTRPFLVCLSTMQMELLKAQRVDFVKLNAWGSLFQWLVALLLLPTMAILEMQVRLMHFSRFVYR